MSEKFKQAKIDYGYLRIFIWTAVAMAGIALGGIYSYLLVFMYFFVSAFDHWKGLDKRNYPQHMVREMAAIKFYRYLTYTQVPVQICCLFFVAWRITDVDTQLYEKIGMTLSSGIIFGNIGINVAHELVHKETRLEKTLGGILLSMVCYATFKIEHLLWHHVHVATPLDPSSARFGQSLYNFLARVYTCNVRNGFRLEAERLKAQNLPVFSRYNELIGWSLLSLSFMLVMYLFFGVQGLIYFCAQSFIAITALEVINYIEHYGLERQQLANGNYEAISHQHSWNSSHMVSNYGLLNLPRHSDHHAFSKRRYQVLRHYDDSPQLPTGYTSMIMLAFIPQLWRKVMDPLVEEHRQRILEAQT